MRKVLQISLLLSLIFAWSINQTTAQGFSGQFAPANWALTSSGDGSVNTTGTPVNIVLTGNDNGASGNTDYAATLISCGSGDLYFDWNYNTYDSPGYDEARYVINGIEYSLANQDGMSGAIGPVSVTTGDIIAFRVYSSDGVAGAGILTISNFNFNSSLVTVDAGLDFSTPANTDFTFNATASGTTPFFLTATPNASIEDYQTTTSVINLPVNVSASMVQSVTININHTYDGDMVISLQAPDGSSIMLSNGNGDGNENYINTVFANSGPSITTGVAPFTGTFMPEEPFSMLTGSANGNWTLIIYDQAGGDSGILLDWTLSIDNLTCSWIPSTGLDFPNLINTVGNIQNTTEYSLLATDANGCYSSDNIIVSVPLSFDINVTNAPCGGVGAVDVTTYGGVPPYTYLWSSGETTEDISGASGNYEVTITDSYAQQIISTATINETPLVLNIASTNVSCFGGDGTIDITVTGGTSYSYLWSTGATTEDLNGLDAGPYAVTVNDIDGCSTSGLVTLVVSDPMSTTISGSDLACNSNNNDPVTSIDLTWLVANCTGTSNVSFFINGTMIYQSPAGICDCYAGINTINITDPAIINLLVNGSNEFKVDYLATDLYMSWAKMTINQNDPHEFILVDYSGGASWNNPDLCAGYQDNNSTTTYGNIVGLSIPSVINLSPVGGNLPYSFNWSNGATIEDIGVLTGGTYDVTITDLSGCTTTNSITINEPAEIITSVTATDITCFGLDNGVIDLTVNGGTTPYTFNWSNGVTTEDNSNAIPGLNSVVVIDANTCSVYTEININEPAELTTSINYLDATCGSTGSIDLTVSGGTTPYTFNWDNGATSEDIASAPAGAYQVTVTDANGCQAFNAAMIIETPLALNVVETNVSCFGGDGSVDITVTGGASYTYNWSNGATTEDINGLDAGTYSVTVSDINGCTISNSSTLIVSDPLTSSITGSDLLCNTNNNNNPVNSIDLTVLAANCTGTATVDFYINGNLVHQDLGGICDCMAGIKTIHITDPAILGLIVDGNNEFTVNFLTSSLYLSWAIVTVNQDISTDYIVADYSGGASWRDENLCDGYTDNGTNTINANINIYSSFSNIDLTVIGGNLPYSFNWDNGATTEDISVSYSGTYNVTITDASGCTTTNSFTVNEPVEMVSSYIKNDVTCFGLNDGAIDLVVINGTTPYSYNWSNGAMSEDIAGIPAGNYSVYVTDLNGCFTTSSNITVNEPNELIVNANVTNVDCNGNATGSIDLSVNGGVAPYNFNWSNSATTEDISGIIAGDYFVTVTDNSGCTSSTSATITEPAALSASSMINNVSCYNGNDGSIDLTVTGGTSLFFANSIIGFSTEYSTTDWGIAQLLGAPDVYPNYGDIEQAWTNATEDSQREWVVVGYPTAVPANGVQIYETFNPGFVDTVYVRNASTGVWVEVWQGTAVAGPEIATINTITFPTTTFNVDAVRLAINETAVIGWNEIDAIGLMTPYTYSWDNGATTEDISGLSAGTYNYTVTDIYGCSLTGSEVITQPDEMVINFNVTNVSSYLGTDGMIDLSVTNGASPFTYSWTGPNGFTATNEDLSGLAAGTYYVTVLDNCNNTITGYVYVLQPDYCTSGLYTTGCIEGDDIGWFKFNDLENNTMFNNCPGTSGYSDFTSLSTTVSQGGTYDITIGTSNPSYEQGFGIWIDFNRDADFDDAGEFVWSSPGTSMAPDIFTGQITIPAWAPSGTTRLRARGIYAGVPTSDMSCTPQNYGEVEDYTVNILNCFGLAANVSSAVNVTCYNGADGSIATDITGGTTPYTYLWSNNATSQNLSNVSEGYYEFTVTDAIGCSATTNTSIFEPAEIIVTSTVTDANCGNNDGTATLSISNGVSPFAENWGTANPAALYAGSYTVTITDATGCVVNHTVNVDNLGTLDATVTTTDVTCFGGNNGTAVLNITGGTSPYTTDWGTANPAALYAGTYNVVVTDFNGCEVIRQAVINQPAQINITATVTNVSCNGGNNGTATLNITGGTPAYTTDWGGADQYALYAGSYIVTVTDINGCTATKNVVITEPSAINLTSNVANVLCNGQNNGSVGITVTGGTPGYLYDWYSPNGFTSNAKDIYNVIAGDYYFTVTDSKGCEETTSVTVAEPAVLTIGIAQLSNILCNGNTAEIEITATGGTTPYTGTGIFAEYAGYHEYIVTDANGCQENTDITISEPDAIDVSASYNMVSCFGGNDGSIDLTITGGVTPYNVVWDNSMTGASISGLIAGDYTGTLTDANGCTASGTSTITEPAELIATANVTQITCNGGTAFIDIIATGGTTPYNGTGTFSVSAGTYDYTVTDANGCSSIVSVIITEPEILSIASDVTNINCFGEATGSIDLTVSGGTTPYYFNWDNAATTEDISGLIAGNYNVTVIDNNGCAANTGFTLTEPAQINVDGTNTNVTCFGGNNGAIDLTITGGVTPYSIVWDNSMTGASISGLIAGDYTGTLTDANGCVLSGTSTITEPAELIATANVTQITCNGGTAFIDIIATGGTTPYDGTGTFSVSAGTYDYTVTDANGCSSTVSVIITEPEILSIASDVTNINCFGEATGNIDLTVSGGTSPYYFNWDNAATTEDISGLIAGNYNVTVTDNNGCVANSSFTLTEPAEALFATGVTTNVTCFGGNDGAFDITVTGGTTPYSFIWDNGATTEDLTNLSAGTYFGTVTDANGCTFSGGDIITEPDQMILSYNVTNVTAYQGTDGAIDLMVANGASPFTFTWSGPNGFTSSDEDLSSLPAGTYQITVLDNCNNTIIGTVDVLQPDYCTSGLYSTGCVEGDDIGWFKFNDLENNTMFNNCPGTIGYSDFTNLSTTVAQGGTYNLTIGTSNPSYEQGFGIWIDFNHDADFDDAGEFVWSSPGTSMAPDIFTGQITIPSDAMPGTTRLRARGIYSDVPTSDMACTFVTYGEVEDYTVNILDCNGLSAVVNSFNDPSCFNGTNGNISTEITGGTTPYTYVWSDNSTTQNLTNIGAGEYAITVTDAIGCTATTSATIFEPLEMTISSSVTDANCGSNDGTAALSIANGTSPYTEDWGTADPMALYAGIYGVTVTDFNGCIKVDTVIVNNLGTLDATVSTTDVTCYGGNNGTASLNITGGTSPYAEDWGTLDPMALPAGDFLVTVIDANNCEVTKPFSIIEGSEIIITATTTNVSCNGGTNGTAVLSITGGTAPYTEDWGTENPTALAAGTYTVTVTDDLGCTNTADITITEPTAISLTFDVANVTCNGSSNGSIEMTVSGGTPGYLYQWNNTFNVISYAKDIYGLNGDNYYVSVTDSKGCQVTNSMTISEPELLGIAVTSTNILCNGTTGAIDLSISGGVTPYTFNWDNGSTSEDLNDVYAGTYNVTVTDANLCTSETSVLMSEPSAIAVTADVTNLTCNGSLDGAIDITVTGGVTPYAFIWSNSVNTEDLSGIEAGSYTLTISDFNNCTFETVIDVTEPSVLELTSVVTNETATGNDGAIDLTVSGGTTPYTFAWSNAETTEDIAGLTMGIYSVIVTDFNGCSETAEIIVSNDACLLTADISGTNATCNGGTDGTAMVVASNGTEPYTITWSNSETTDQIINLFAGTYDVTVADAVGCMADASITITEPEVIAIDVLSQDISCNGLTDGSIDITVSGGTTPYTYNWTGAISTEDLADLTAGTYDLTVTDANGCYGYSSAVISEPSAISASTIVTNVSCNGYANGAIDLTVSGGTTPYSFEWSNGLTDEDIADVVTGTYDITITDANGCTLITSETITEPDVLSLSYAVTNETATGNDGAIDLTVSGGTTPYTFIWSNTEATEDISGLAMGFYSITVVDFNACIAEETILVGNESCQIALNMTGSDVLCNGGNTGEAAVEATNGTEPYVFTWDNASDNDTISDLTAGTYYVTVEDAVGCLAMNSIMISEPDAITTFITSNNPTCNGLADGTATVTIIGGTTPYSILWSDLSTVPTVINQPAGWIYIDVVDANGCMANDSVEFIEPAILAVDTIYTVNASTSESTDGEIYTITNGGTAPYSYEWSNTAITPDLVGIFWGTYDLTVTDANGCQATLSVFIDFVDAINAAIADNLNISMYPNPNGGMLNVSSNYMADIYIYNIIGELVYSKPMNALTAKIDLTNLADGSYIIKIVAGEKVVNAKLELRK